MRAAAAHRQELAIASLAMLALAVTIYGGHITDGGFALDDWTIADALRREPGASGLSAVINPRPLQFGYLFVVGHLIGVNHAAWLLWAVLLAAAASAALYLVLREARFSTVPAGAAAVLLLVFPYADSLKLWAATSAANAAIALALTGVWLTLLSLRHEGRRAAVMVASGAAVQAAAVLLYEHALAIIGFGLILFMLRASRRRSSIVLVVELLAAGAAAAWVVATSTAPSQPDASAALRHLGSIIGDAPELLGRAATPLDKTWPVAVVAVVLVVAWGAVSARRRPELRASLLLAGIGALVILGAYLILAPSVDWYVPLRPGQGTRTNAAAAIGWALLFAGVIGLIGDAARRPLVPVVLVALLSVNWAAQSAADGRDWADASLIGESAVALAGSSPELMAAPEGTRVFSFGVPRSSAPEVPVFIDERDFGAALRLTLNRPLAGVPVFVNSTVTCGSQGPDVTGGFQSDAHGSYGASFFLDYTNRRVLPVRDRRTCQSLLSSGTLRGGELTTWDRPG